MDGVAGTTNLHEKGVNKVESSKRLRQNDIDHAPSDATILPRKRKENDKVEMPKKVVQTRNKTEAEPSKSKKRKAEPIKPPVAAKRRNKARMTTDDEIEDQNRSNIDGLLPQLATEGSTSARTLPQKQTRSRMPRKNQAIATQAYFEGNKSMDEVARKKVGEDQDNDSMDDAAGHLGEEDDEELGFQTGELQESGTERRVPGNQATRNVKALKKPTKAGKTRTKRNKEGKPKPAEQLTEEQRQKDAEEMKIHEARPLGHYSDPVLADRFRVIYKTVRVRTEEDGFEGVEPARTDQLGTWRDEERYYEKAKKERRKIELWMGGGASPPRSWSEGYEDRPSEDW